MTPSTTELLIHVHTDYRESDAPRRIDTETLLREVLTNAHQVRGEYLDWLREVYQFRDHQMSKNTRRDHDLVLRSLAPHLSSHYATARESLAVDVTRLLALFSILASLEAESVLKIQGGEGVATVIQAWCKRFRPDLIVRYESNPVRGLRAPRTRPLHRLRLELLRALGRLLVALTSAGLRRFASPGQGARGEFDLVIFDDTTHLSLAPDEPAGFRSRNWGLLPTTLASSATKALWLHKYTSHNSGDSARAVRRTLRRINRADPNGYHVLIDDFCDLRTFGRATSALLTAAICPSRLFQLVRLPETSRVPELTALEVNRFLADIPHVLSSQLVFASHLAGVRAGVKARTYLLLCEGQAWEYLLEDQLSRHDGHRLVKFVNSPVGIWGLRLANWRSPVPDKNRSRGVTWLAASPELAYELSELGNDPSLMVALRPESDPHPSGPARSGLHWDGPPAQAQQLTIAVFLDYEPSSEGTLNALLSGLPLKTRERYRWIVKRHPAAPPIDGSCPIRQIEFWTEDSTSLLEISHASLTSCATSMSSQSLRRGMPTAVFVDRARLPNVQGVGDLQPWPIVDADELVLFLDAIEGNYYHPIVDSRVSSYSGPLADWAQLLPTWLETGS